MHVIGGGDAYSAASRFLHRHRRRRFYSRTSYCNPSELSTYYNSINITLGGIVLVRPTTAKQRPCARVMCEWRAERAREWCARGKWVFERDCACAWEYESLLGQPGSTTAKQLVREGERVVYYRACTRSAEAIDCHAASLQSAAGLIQLFCTQHT